MLSLEERAAIEHELAQVEGDARAAAVEALKIVQRRAGYVNDEALEDVAEFLKLSPHELEGLATFYNLIFRKPVGRHVILVCDSISCWILGCDALRRRLTGKLGAEFGRTTADSRFTLLTIPCLGCCDRAPAMMVDEDLHADLTPEKLDAILEGYA